MYVVRFDYPEGTVYAGMARDGNGMSAGWAPTVDTAARFDDRDGAERFLNAYSVASQVYAVVEEVA